MLSASFEKNKEDFLKVLEEHEELETSPENRGIIDTNNSKYTQGDSIKKSLITAEIVKSQEIN